MANPLNRELATTPTIVPASFSPAPEKYERQVGQELRARQAQLGQGYTLKQVDYLKLQQHRAPYKRDAAWQSATPEEMAHAVKVAKTARTLMLQDVPVWAGSLDEDELQNALPNIWNEYVERVMNENDPAPKTTVDLTAGHEVQQEVPVNKPISPEEISPVQVIFRPLVSADEPKSQVTVPAGDQLTLGDILSKIEAKKEK